MLGKKKIVATVFGVLAILILGVVATIVGNVGIRRVQPPHDITLSISQPVVPGVETSLKWSGGQTLADEEVEVKLRARGFDQAIGAARLADQSAAVVFPCTIEGGDATVSLITSANKEVLGWIGTSVLPPGPDCLR